MSIGPISLVNIVADVLLLLSALALAAIMLWQDPHRRGRAFALCMMFFAAYGLSDLLWKFAGPLDYAPRPPLELASAFYASGAVLLTLFALIFGQMPARVWRALAAFAIPAGALFTLVIVSGRFYREIEPLQRGAGFEFVDKVVGGAVPRNYIPSVERGLRNQLAEGILAGYPCIDVRVTLTDGKAHSVDSSDQAFQTAAAQALRAAANDSTVSLLEPVDLIEVLVADDYVGAVMADLRSRRAQVQGTEPGDREGHTVIRAEVPQHELARYPIDLRSVSHGSGSFTRSFVRYDYLPANLARELTG